MAQEQARQSALTPEEQERRARLLAEYGDLSDEGADEDEEGAPAGDEQADTAGIPTKPLSKKKVKRARQTASAADIAGSLAGQRAYASRLCPSR